MTFVTSLSTRWVRVAPRPTDIVSKVNAYFQKKPSRPNNLRYLRALEQTEDAFRLATPVAPFHINDSIRHFKHPDRSPGLPYTSYGLRRKDEVDPNVIKQFAHNLKYGIFNKCRTPCNAVAKSMVGKVPKFRLIWVYPAHMTFIEGMFAQPLLHAYQQLRFQSPYAIWISYAKAHMRWIQRRKPYGWRWLSLDWSAFDSDCCAWEIRDAFNILRKNINFSCYQEYGKPTHAHTLPRLWTKIVHYFVNTPVKLPDGRVVVTYQGVPSGSFFTNLIDSIINHIRVMYLLHRFTIDKKAKWVLGDDFLVAVKEIVSLLELSREAMEVFGAKLNPDKSEFGEYVGFLGYGMSPTGTPMADYNKLVAQLLLPRVPDKSRFEFATRIRALQLSCFGVGCLKFTFETQAILEAWGMTEITPDLHPRDDLAAKLEALDLAHWPPLKRLMQVVM
jgi:hypothetical protein